MTDPKNISTFEELEERKRALELEEEVTRRELAHSLGTSRVNLNNFLLKRIALPIGGAIAGLWLVSKIAKKKHTHTHEVHHETVVREVPSGDVAKNHFPVPPPRPSSERKAPGYVARRPGSQAAMSGKPSRNEEEDDLNMDNQTKKNVINAATLASIARVAVPAVKMIMKSVEKYKADRGEQVLQDDDSLSGTVVRSAARILPTQDGTAPQG